MVCLETFPQQMRNWKIIYYSSSFLYLKTHLKPAIKLNFNITFIIYLNTMYKIEVIKEDKHC